MKFSISSIVFLAAAVVLTLTGCRNEANLIPETCFDGIQNQGETGIDCGGPNCEACAPTCEDGESNQGEFSPVSATNPNVIGIDCGGEFCPPCATCDDGIRNAHWVRDPNLTPGELNQDSVGISPNGILYRLVMERGIDCGFPCDSVCPPSCDDGIMNGFETGVDCGGPNCPPCAFPPNCNDGIQNGLETGIDCGSPECPLNQQACPDPTCSDGIQNTHIELTDILNEGYILVVEAGIDCDNNPNTSCPDCPAPTCFDGIVNGGETGVDCGGPCFTLCSEDATCNDGIMNGDEIGIDCGGPDCPPCPNCSDEFKNGPELNVDCLDYPIPSYTQEDGTECPLCPSCHDGEQTQSLFELDIDCGGQCEPCDQYFIVSSISNNNVQGNQQFLDQFTFNEALSMSGNNDTISVTNALDVGGDVGGVIGAPYRRIRAIQRINVPGNGTFERVFEVLLEGPVANLEDTDVLDIDATGFIPEGTTVRYREGFIDGEFQGTKVYQSVLPIIAEGDPANSQFSVDYNFSNESGGLLRGEINFVRLQENTPINPGFRFAFDIEFAIQYNPFATQDLQPPLNQCCP